MEPDRTVSDWHLVLQHEHELTDRFKSFHGDMFIDVGAHVGTWTLRLHKNFKRVICFEPHPSSAMALRANIANEGAVNVEIAQMALSDSDGWADMALYTNPSHSTLLSKNPLLSKDGPPPPRIRVRMERLDSRLAAERSKIDLVKIDVEGFEEHVVAGALGTLRRHKPAMLIELHGEGRCERIQAMLSEFKFEVLGAGDHKSLLHLPSQEN